MQYLRIYAIISSIIVLMSFSFLSCKTDITHEDNDNEILINENNEIEQARIMLNGWIEFSKETLSRLEAVEDPEEFELQFGAFLETADTLAVEEAKFITDYPDFDLYGSPQLKEEWEELRSINHSILNLRDKF